MGAHITVQKREIVIRLFKSGKSQRKMSKVANRSSSTVQHIRERYRKDNRIINKVRTSPKTSITQQDERWLLRQIKRNPVLSASKLTVELKERLNINMCAETMRRVSRKHNLHGRVAGRKPYINQRNQKMRLKFAEEHVNKDLGFQSKTIFFDKSKFNIFGSDGRPYVWTKTNEDILEKNLYPTIKHEDGSVMVWGCMDSSGVGNLYFIEGKMKWTGYLDILKQNLKASAIKFGIKDDFNFYQGNDPKSIAYWLRSWGLFNCPKVQNVLLNHLTSMSLRIFGIN